MDNHDSGTEQVPEFFAYSESFVYIFVTFFACEIHGNMVRYKVYYYPAKEF